MSQTTTHPLAPLKPTPLLPDKYQLAIEYLIDHPDEIEAAWSQPKIHAAGCLFLCVTPDGSVSSIRTEDGHCYGVGCLTQICGGHNGIPIHACTSKLTNAIKADERIPLCKEEITLLDLPVFAEWQRRLDVEIR